MNREHGTRTLSTPSPAARHLETHRMGPRTTRRRVAAVAAIAALTAVGGVHDASSASRPPTQCQPELASGLVPGRLVRVAEARCGADARRPSGTVWVGNRGFPNVTAFDAATLQPLRTVALGEPASDVAIGAGGTVFVGEENANRIAVIDGATGAIITRIATAARPHHLEASRNGRWITYGAFGSNRVGVIDADAATLLGEWPASGDPTARSHASVITPNGRTVYVANDVTHEITALDVRSGTLLFSIPVHHAHELALTRDQRTLYVTARGADLVHVVDLRRREVTASLPVGPTPDTLELVDQDRILTVGLRGNPAQIAVVRTDPLEVVEIVTIAGPGTVAGHQWTSANGRWTVAAYEGGPLPGIALVDHGTGEIVTAPFPNGGRPHGLDVDRRAGR